MKFDISHETYKKSTDIHGTVLYPAMMVAPVQKAILSWLIKDRKGLKIFDPFQGSGTALYEAATITSDMNLLGFDINPLASLIAHVKLQGVDNQTFDNDVLILETLIKSDFDFVLEPFYKSEKWFRPDIFYTLSKIKFAIRKILNKQNRQYFWVMFCDIVRHYSNTRSSTFKLHIKEQNKIDALKNTIIRDYIKKVKNSRPFYNKNFRNYELKKGNSLELLKSIPDCSIDILVTSPPYGENATTVTYGQFSYLPLSFIDLVDIPLEGWELKNCQIIDSTSLGGTKALRINDDDRKYIEWYINRIKLSKRKKVERFFADYFNFLNSAARVTKEYIDITLGNRTVDRVRINLARITVRYLEDRGFKHKKTLTRAIVSKRTPSEILVDGLKTTTMMKEYVVIMERANTNTGDNNLKMRRPI